MAKRPSDAAADAAAELNYDKQRSRRPRRGDAPPPASPRTAFAAAVGGECSSKRGRLNSFAEPSGLRAAWFGALPEDQLDRYGKPVVLRSLHDLPLFPPQTTPGLLSLLRTLGVSSRGGDFAKGTSDARALLAPLLEECAALDLSTEVKASDVQPRGFGRLDHPASGDDHEQVRALAIRLIEKERRLVQGVTEGVGDDGRAALVADAVKRLLARAARTELKANAAIAEGHRKFEEKHGETTHARAVSASAVARAARLPSTSQHIRRSAERGNPLAAAELKEAYEEAAAEDGLAPPRTGVSRCRRQSRAAAANAPPPPPPLRVEAGKKLDLSELQLRLEYPHAQLVANGDCPYTLHGVGRGLLVVGELSQPQLAAQCEPLAAFIVANMKRPIWPGSDGTATSVSTYGHVNLLAGDGRGGSNRFFAACNAIEADYCPEFAAALRLMEKDRFTYVRVQAYSAEEAGFLHKDGPKLADDDNSVATPLCRFAINLFGDRGFVLSPQQYSFENATVAPRRSGGEFVVMQPEQYIDRPDKGLDPLMFHCADAGADPGLTLVVEPRQPNDPAEQERVGSLDERIRGFGMQCVTVA